MTRLEEIESRLAAIPQELEAEGADLDALENEVRTLKEEQRKITAAAEQRKKLLDDIAAGKAGAEKKSFEEGPNMEERTFAVETPEYRIAFLKNLQGKELTVEERTAVTASAVIPTQTWNRIVEKMEMVAPLISKVTVTQIPGNLTVPVEGTTADVAWVAMGTAATDSEDTLGSVSLAAYKLIKTVEIGADVMAMSIDSFESYIINKLYKKMAKAVENAIINGTGSSQATGLALAGQITNTGEFTNSGMTYDDILTIIADLPDAGYRQDACFVMPSALFYSDVLPALTDKGSGLDVQAAEKMKVLNYDVILCDRLAADTVIFGDLSYYHFNWAQQAEIKADSSVAFRTGSTVYRALALADGKMTNAAAFNKYARAAS